MITTFHDIQVDIALSGLSWDQKDRVYQKAIELSDMVMYRDVISKRLSEAYLYVEWMEMEKSKAWATHLACVRASLGL